MVPSTSRDSGTGVPGTSTAAGSGTAIMWTLPPWSSARHSLPLLSPPGPDGRDGMPRGTRVHPSGTWTGRSARAARSEERRVGEEGRSRGAPDHLKKNKITEDATDGL